MVAKEQILNGLITYLDTYVMPELPTSGKWALGAGVVILSGNYKTVFKNISSEPMIKALNVIDSKDNVDIDTLASALKQSAEKYGKMSVSIPIVGILTFSSDDITKLYECIKGGASA